ncbi:MAG: VWA domain-containing protein [Candidatus Fermentibacteraceae bacterium]|nr:VWA domain-containing protein [Candidatus Fermentibacteraceae bacterium]
MGLLGIDIPFSAIQGLDKARLALQIALTDPVLGGVLILGTRGSGKSALMRSTRFLHPELDADRAIVKVPLGVTEENLTGSLDLSTMLSTGKARLNPGLMERADGRILLIEDVNLLNDRLVDLILDCAASGVLTVEREGISVSTTSRFKLLATMDPDEGRLRPQLLDRFDLSVEVGSLGSAKERADLIRRLLAFEYIGEKAAAGYRRKDAILREKIIKARRRLSRVGIKVRTLASIAFAMSYLEMDGHRPEMVITRAAGALASLRGRTKVIWNDVRDAAVLVTGHRTRKGGLEGPPKEKALVSALKAGWGIGSKYGASDILLRLWDSQSEIFTSISSAMDSHDDSSKNVWSNEMRQLNKPDGMFTSEFPEFMESRAVKKLVDKIALTAKPGSHGAKNTRMQPSIEQSRGKPVRVVATGDAGKMNVYQSVIAAVTGGEKLPLVPLEKRWWRAWERSSRPRAVVMIIIDASKSSSDYLFGLSKLLRTLFENHFDSMSKVGLVSMHKGKPVLHFKPTRNRLRVYGRVAELISSGYTPLGEALMIARRTLKGCSTTSGRTGSFVLLVSDCAPEPLPLGCQDPYESDLYAGVRKEAQMCGIAHFPILIIDPMNYTSLKSPEILPGRRLARFIEKVTAGMLIHMPASIMDRDNLIVKVISSMTGNNEYKTISCTLDSEIGKYSNTTPWLRG